MDPAEDDQIVAAGGGERQRRQVDAVVHGRHVVELRRPGRRRRSTRRRERGRAVRRQDARVGEAVDGRHQRRRAELARRPAAASRGGCARGRTRPTGRSAWATCSASQTRPSIAGILRVRTGQHAVQRRRVSESSVANSVTSMPAGDQPLGEQAGDLLPGPVVHAAACARRSAPAARSSPPGDRLTSSSNVTAAARRLQSGASKRSGPGGTRASTRRPRCRSGRAARRRRGSRRWRSRRPAQPEPVAPRGTTRRRGPARSP